MNTFQEVVERYAAQIRSADVIEIDEIPNIDLYMDQVTTFIDDNLKSMKRHEDDKMLTKTMINNYTKYDLLPSPDKKKYSKDHMLLLIFLYYFKSFLSISDIKEIMEPLGERYFGGKDEISLEEVYSQILVMGENMIQNQTQDILQKYQQSKELFEQETDPEKHKFLTDFAFLCSLSLDVYLKKAMIENLLDNQILGGSSERRAEMAKEAKSKEGKTGEKK